MQRKSDEGAAQVTMRQIAERCGIDPSSVRKYLRKMGIVLRRVPHSHFREGEMLAITPEEFERLLEDRRARGLSTDCNGSRRDWKWFYAILTHPDRDPPGVHRVKLGIGHDPDERLGRHRSVTPTAETLKCWPCRTHCEKAAITSISRTGVIRAYSGEVFDFDDIDAMLARGDSFFANFPRPDIDQPTSIIPTGSSRSIPAANPAAAKGGGTDSSQDLPPVAVRPTWGATPAAPSSAGGPPENHRPPTGVRQINMSLIFQE